MEPMAPNFTEKLQDQEHAIDRAKERIRERRLKIVYTETSHDGWEIYGCDNADVYECGPDGTVEGWELPFQPMQPVWYLR